MQFFLQELSAFSRTGIAPLRLCNSNTILLLWPSTLLGHSNIDQRNRNVAAAMQCVSRSCTFVTCSCQQANSDTLDGRNSSALQARRERQELPNFWHKDSKEPLWLKFYKPAWVDAQLTVLDTRIGRPARPTFNPTFQDNPGPPTVHQCQGDVIGQTVSKLCEQGHLTGAVDALTVLAETECRVSASLLYSVLKRCVAEKNLVVGRRLHDLCVKLGYESNTFLGNHILRMYACQGRLQEAMDVFNRVTTPDAFMWSSIISAHSKHGKPRQAIQLYHEMRSSGVQPDGHVSVAALQACAIAADLESGRQVHYDVLETGIPPNLFVCSSLVGMYAKCGKLEDARRVFDRLATKNVVTWNAMISGYTERGLDQEALALYGKMEQEDRILADGVTYICLLKACASVGALQQGQQLHSQILGRGQLKANVVVGNHLVDMYAKCGELQQARKVFDALSTRDVVTWNIMIAGYAKCGSLTDARRLFNRVATKDVVTWNAMISGYAEHGFGQEALALYAQMEQEDLILADGFTFACLLKACASVGASQQGKQLHSQILKRGLLEGDIVVGSCLVDMYAKCGQVEDACRVFYGLPTKDVVAWNAMISGYGRSNEGHRAIACFEEMFLAGVQPDETTFTCLLVACSHEGLVDEGRQYFNAMVEQYGILPTTVHYNCMVDLLGRAGHLDEAENMLLSCGSKNDAVGLMSLLNACTSHGDIERGTRYFESLVRMDPEHASPYVLMANMYADAGRWPDVDRIERVRKLVGANKKPAVAGIEVKRQVHTFVVGEGREDISCKVQSTNVRLKEEGGHVPHTNLVLKPLCEKEKEDELCGHAEKLALAYGLLNTPNGTPLLVTKNLRMCRDCHSSTEIMSRIEKRDIVVRDAYRVHRFEAGSCSCKGRP